MTELVAADIVSSFQIRLSCCFIHASIGARSWSNVHSHAVAAFGGSRASNAIEVLDLCLPIWIEIKRQQKSYEHEQMRAALEIALSKFTGDHEQMRAAVETALRKRFGELPETGEKEQDEGTVAPRRRRK
jgi:hypothetical protein